MGAGEGLSLLAKLFLHRRWRRCTVAPLLDFKGTLYNTTSYAGTIEGANPEAALLRERARLPYFSLLEFQDDIFAF